MTWDFKFVGNSKRRRVLTDGLNNREHRSICFSKDNIDIDQALGT